MAIAFFRLMSFACLAFLGLALPEEVQRDLGAEVQGHRRKKVRWLEGHVTHGLNVFNGKRVFDFHDSSHLLDGVTLETIGVFNPDPFALNATSIRDDTDPGSLIATLCPGMFHSSIFGGFVPVQGPFNVPVYAAPTMTMFSHYIDDRHGPAPFDASYKLDNLTNYAVFRKEQEMTLGQYNSARGEMRISCSRDGSARIKLRFEAVPLALYTVWDMIIIEPLTTREWTVPSPLGGVPNVIATDRKGYGQMTRKLNYCPLRKCEGAHWCSAAIILNYHIDNMVYGAAIDLGVQGYGPGSANTIHMMFATNGVHVGQTENPM